MEDMTDGSTVLYPRRIQQRDSKRLQKNKEGKLVILYTSNPGAQLKDAYIQRAKLSQGDIRNDEAGYAGGCRVHQPNGVQMG